MKRPDVLLDCRWLPFGGAGRVTELLLRGLSEAPPQGRWLLWGPPRTRELAWSGAEVRITSDDPRALIGQRAWRSIPDCELAVFLHYLRPLRPVPSLTWIYDTIPVRYGSGVVGRRCRQLFLRRVAAISRRVVTTTDYAGGCIRRDLGVDDARVVVAPLPFDDELAARIGRLRQRVAGVDAALYVGRFGVHKNLHRLVDAFGRTAFRRHGGTLILVGGSPAEVRALEARLSSLQRSWVQVRPTCSQDELDNLFASSLIAVQPSLEEGFGLPAWEALTCGLPVCVSDGGALPEVTRGLVDPFPASSVDAMSVAIDECAERARLRPDDATDRSRRLRERAVSMRGFAEGVCQVVGRELA